MQVNRFYLIYIINSHYYNSIICHRKSRPIHISSVQKLLYVTGYSSSSKKALICCRPYREDRTIYNILLLLYINLEGIYWQTINWTEFGILLMKMGCSILFINRWIVFGKFISTSKLTISPFFIGPFFSVEQSWCCHTSPLIQK